MGREEGKQRPDALVEALVGEQGLVIGEAGGVELVAQHVGVEAQAGEVVGGAQLGVQVAVVEQGLFEVGHEHGPAGGGPQHVVAEVQAGQQVLVAERTDGRMVLLGFARTHGGERVHAFGNEAVVGQGGFQGEVGGRVDAVGGEPEQGLLDGRFGEAVPAVDDALQVAAGLPLDQPALVEIGESLAQLVAGYEALGSEAVTDTEVIHF